MVEQILKSQYEIKRQSFIFNALNPEIYAIMDKSYLFCLHNRMYPFFHEGDKDRDLYSSAYEINRDFIEEMHKYAVNIWENKDIPNLYQIINKFNFSNKPEEYDLITFFRYCKMSRHFDDNFYDRLIEWGPSHRNIILEPFDIKEIYCIPD